MKIDTVKLEMALARSCKTLSDFRNEGLSPQTLTRVKRCADVMPVTVGKIAKALGVDPADIIAKEDGA